MKKFILLIAVSFSINLFAADYIRPEGFYDFTSVETTQIRDVELVPTKNNARYKELVALKFQCSLHGTFYMCQKHSKVTDLPHILKDLVTKEWLGRFFEFTLSELTPNQINESDSLFEWEFFDQVKFEGAHVFDYHYYLLKGDSPVHKIALNFLTGKKWLVIKDEKTLMMPVQKVLKESQFKARVYELSLRFAQRTPLY